MARPFPSSPDQTAVLRNLKVLVVLLVVSNVLVGVLGVYLLRAVDRRYSELVGRAVPALNDLRELMTDTIGAMRATSPIVFNGAGSNRAEALRAMDGALATQQQFLAGLVKNLGDQPDARESLRTTGEAFATAIGRIEKLYAGGQDQEAARMREDQLRPAFERHLDAIGRAADSVEASSLGASKAYASRTNSLSAIVLGVASWPVILVVGILLLTALFVVAMMIAFRGKDLADAS